MRLRNLTRMSLSLFMLVVVMGLGFNMSSKTHVVSTGSREAWVDDDDPTCGERQPCFRTIQDAVNAVEDSENGVVLGATVYILSGLYRENVLIERAVSLRGVGTVRLEPRDPQKPTILISYGLGYEYGISIENLEIATGSIGIEVVDSIIRDIGGNCITNMYAPLGLTTPSPYLQAKAGVLIRGKSTQRGFIYRNTISGMYGGIVLEDKVAMAKIQWNTIRNTGVGILLRNQHGGSFPTLIINNLLEHNGAHIVVENKAQAYIASNQLLLALAGQGISIRWGGRATVENNLISGSMIGISTSPYSSDPFAEPVDPLFEIIRNRIIGNRQGLVIASGQGKVLRNVISENGYSADPEMPSPMGDVFANGVGILLGQKVKVEISYNQIINNTLGIAYGDNAYSGCQQSLANRPFEGELIGSANEIHNNEFADLCPSLGFPWPPGFRK